MSGKYKIDSHYFENIDSEEKAYLLGYIAADGCITKTKNTYRFSIKSIDKELISTLRKCIGFSGPIRLDVSINTNPIYMLSVYDQEFISHLMKHDIVPRKTFKLIYPWFLRKKFIRHYMRGYLDGDGSVSCLKDNKRLQFNIVGTFSTIKGFAEHLYTEGIMKGDTIYREGNIFRLQRSQKQAECVLGYLYKDTSIFLDRKYQKYNQYKENVSCNMVA